MPSFALAVLVLAQSAPRELPVFVWRRGREPSDVVRAFGGACIGRLDDDAGLVREELDYFVFNAPGRNDLHLEREDERYQSRWKRWYETRDDALAVREPCLTASQTRARLEHLLDESLAAREGRFGRGISLGDEVGLTPGGAPDDVCLSPTCREAWRAWWPEHSAGGGEAPDLASISTDAVLRALAAGDTRPIGPWLARRRFHQDVLIDLVERLARRSRERSAAPVGLLGIAGQSAFGGVAVERALPGLDFVECYRTGNARELLFTLRRPGQQAWATLFVSPHGALATAHAAWDHWIRGGDGFVVWSEADLVRAPEQSAPLLGTLAKLRELDLRRGSASPSPRGIAIVHSPASVAASWLRDALLDGATWPRRFQSWQEEHGTLETARARWFELAEEHGAMPGALPLDQVGAATAQRFGVLVLVEQLVVDSADLERLREFARAGGRSCIDGEFAWIDSRGERRSDEARAELRRELGALAPPEMLAALVPGVARRDATEAWWREARVESAPWTIAGDAGAKWTWTSTWVQTPAGLIGAVLPREPRAPWPERVEIRPRDGMRVEAWHPSANDDGSLTLPAGGAAAFRLVAP